MMLRTAPSKYWHNIYSYSYYICILLCGNTIRVYCAPCVEKLCGIAEVERVSSPQSNG